MNFEQVIARLKSLANPDFATGATHFGITPTHQHLGVRVPEIRALAKEIKKDHTLAQQLWASDLHEARLLATMIADRKQVTEALMESWVSSFDSWDICDQACSNLFCRTPLAQRKVLEWSARPEEFVKRAAFALIAYLTHHDKKISDEQLAQFLPLILREATDNRNFVKKAVNWALREIGKHNLYLNGLAIQTAQQLSQMDSKAAKWIAADALRELTSEKVQEKLRKST